MRHFARPQLAQSMTDDLLAQTVFGDASNGIFLTAPRRTGKSTFLQADLRPELEKRGTLVVYCDLWENRERDPAELVRDAIMRELNQQVSLFTRAAKRTRIESVTVPGWLKMDTSKVAWAEGSSLVDTLRGLNDLSGKPIALIIDEAQHALVSGDGETIMFTLKSARDQLNRPGNVKLMLVMSGSDRDKLLRLVNAASAPFFGSTIKQMPDLGSEFIDFVCTLVAEKFPNLYPVDPGKMLAAFALVGYRPQQFAQLLGEALSPLSIGQGGLDEKVYALCALRRTADEQQMLADFLALGDLEQTILWRLLQLGEQFRPYDTGAQTFYKQQLGRKVSTTQIQNALETLRTRSPALLWKSARGDYSLADTLMGQWYRQRVAQGTWPPVTMTGGTS